MAPSSTAVLTSSGTGESPRQALTVSMLPDNVLLGIFELYRLGNDDPYDCTIWDWHIPVHVCRRWRQIIYASPHRLNLKILCTHSTPVKKLLDIWPAFPIAINYRGIITPNDEDNIVAALDSKHLERVCFVALRVTSSQLRKMAAMMQEPFPVLSHLQISLEDRSAPVLPVGFLGSSAPCLQKLSFDGVSYSVLQTLLLSASGLVELRLRRTDYISPEAMVVSLAGLPKLEDFYFGFQRGTPLPDRTRPPPITRIVLPALAFFRFRGDSEYLEDLISRIDSPQLINISIVYLRPPDDFPAAQHVDFIDRSVGPKSTGFRRARVAVRSPYVTLDLYRHENPPRGNSTTITPKTIRWHTSHMPQVLSQFSATLSNVVHLELDGYEFGSIYNVGWRRLLQQCSAVQTLKVSSSLASQMARTLEDVTDERIPGLFPSLGLICLQDHPESSIEKIVALRRLSGLPVTVVNTESEFDKRVESYMNQENIPHQLHTP